MKNIELSGLVLTLSSLDGDDTLVDRVQREVDRRRSGADQELELPRSDGHGVSVDQAAGLAA